MREFSKGKEVVILLFFIVLNSLLIEVYGQQNINLPKVEVIQLKNKKVGFADIQTGKKANKEKFDSVLAFNNGFFIVLNNEKFSFVNGSGFRITNDWYDSVRNFHNEIAAVKLNEKWGFINSNGELTIPYQYDLVFDFIEVITKVYKDGKWELINVNGEHFKYIQPLPNVSERFNIPNYSSNKVNSISIEGVSSSGQCPPNLDFEYGSFTNWSCFNGNTSATSSSNIITVSPAPPTAGRHSIYPTATASLDYYGGFPINPPNGSGYSVKLGNDLVGAQAERIRYVINVPNVPDYSITFQYAVVLENPDSASTGVPHNHYEQPRFTAKLFDPITNEYLQCGSFTYVASLVPGFFNSPITTGGIYSSPSGANIKYKPWSAVYVNLNKYQGRTLNLEFTTADCTKGGHFGYAYVDVVECGITAKMQYNCTLPNVTTMEGPPGFKTYKWFNNNFSSILGTNQTLVLNPGPAIGTKFWVVTKPYNNTDCNSCDCTDTLGVEVAPTYPLADAGPDRFLCSGNSVSIGSSSIQGNSYIWSPSNFLSNPNAAITNSNPLNSTSYQVKVTNNITGCSAVDSVNIIINPVPIAKFTINSNIQCLKNNRFNFTNASIISSGVINYYWSFGDGNFSTIANPNHSYLNSGNYTVKLIASTINGCIDSISKVIVVNPTLIADFNINNQLQCLKANNFSFAITFNNIPSAYSWSFGDGFGSSSLMNPQYSFIQSGTYDVSLITTTSAGCKDTSIKPIIVSPDPKSDFRINNPAQCVNANNFIFTNQSSITSGALNYLWNFGDGTGTSNLTSPFYSYSNFGAFEVRLIALSLYGCKDTTKKFVTIYPKPIVDYHINSSAQCLPGNNFTFSNNSSLTSGSLSYIWSFGDGVTSTSLSPNHSYSAAGIFMVKLVAKSGNNCTDSLTYPINVNNIPFVTVFNNRPNTFCLGDSVILFAKAFSGGSNIIKYEWYRNGVFMPGISDTIITVFQSGSYYVAVTNSYGCKNISVPINVTVNPLPNGSISIPATYNICDGDAVNLSASGAQFYQWYQDGVVIQGANSPTYLAGTAGVYSVRLRNQFGCEANGLNTVKMVLIKKPIADFSFNYNCISTPIIFRNGSNILNSGGGNLFMGFWGWKTIFYF